jgi:8-oxo-dGTP diphosphatase
VNDPIRVVAGVLVRDGKALVCKRSPAGPHAGKWEFPGGKTEPGETLAQALRRELREELGIVAEVGGELWQTQHRYPGTFQVELHFLAVVAFEGDLRGDDHFAEVRWQALERLGELDFLEADHELVAHLTKSRRADTLNGSAPPSAPSTSGVMRSARRPWPSSER